MSANGAPPGRQKRAGWVQCNVELPEADAVALDAHIERTGVPKRDFVLVAIRHEIESQRASGLGLATEAATP